MFVEAVFGKFFFNKPKTNQLRQADQSYFFNAASQSTLSVFFKSTGIMGGERNSNNGDCIDVDLEPCRPCEYKTCKFLLTLLLVRDHQIGKNITQSELSRAVGCVAVKSIILTCFGGTDK